MVLNRKFVERARSVSGVALVVIGMFVFYQHLSYAASKLSHMLCNNRGDATGALPALVMAASCVVQAYADDHQAVFHVLVRQIWISLWPLLLVVAGTILSRNAFKEDTHSVQKKDWGLVDTTASRSTLSRRQFNSNKETQQCDAS